MVTVCFTGHRPQNLPFGFNEKYERCIGLKKKMRKEIVKMIEERSATNFISGMALGVDIFASEIVIELKKQHPEITLECALPCKNQDAKWNSIDQKRYKGLLSLADKITVVQESYTKSCMQKRNEYMVDNSQFLLCVWNGKGSGTGNTVKYAKIKGKGIILINPNET